MNSFGQQSTMYPPPYYQPPVPQYQQTFIHNNMMFVNQKVVKSPQKMSGKRQNMQ